MSRILVPLFGNEKIDAIALDVASSLAKKNGALIDARLFCRDAASSVPFVGEGLTPELMEQLCDSAQAQIDAEAEHARAHFNAWCARKEIPLGDVAAQGSVAANFAVRQGSLPSIIVEPARVSDLTIFACTSNNSDSDRHALAEAVLLDAQRPLLLLPEKAVSTIARKIMIAWNGSAEAARAVTMSLDILKAADSVSIVTIGDCIDPKNLAISLQSNGVTATPHVVNLRGTNDSQVLHEQVEKFGADLMIIGAYSHNRLREVVFGGVTRDIFDKTSVPTLMVH